MTDTSLRQKLVEAARHRTAFHETGPVDGPLMIFIHGWPGMGVVWRAQLTHFAARGWRCFAPDMRGYGGSSVPAEPSAYALREIVGDMTEFHDALGGPPAVWVGHDWGSAVVWQLAAGERTRVRCRAVVNLNVPYIPTGFALEELVPLVDRQLYPADRYPFGQWDYQQFYRENAAEAARQFEADVPAFLRVGFRRGDPSAVGRPASQAGVRAQGGWFGPAGRPPQMPHDQAILSADDLATMALAFQANGFHGPDSWYLNGDANRALARESPDDGRLTLPVLFLHAAWDVICDTVHSPLAGPMRAACADLTEATFDAGHWLAQERPAEVNTAIERWLTAKRLA